MLILQIDASSYLCSVALAHAGELLHLEINTEPYQHGRDINNLIQTTLDTCGYRIDQIEGVCVNQGPGSYTALRIGMATAKGLCYGLDIPLVSISGLDFLTDYAMIKHPDAEFYVPMIDARRMEVYTCDPRVDLSDSGSFHAKILNTDSYAELKSKRICFIGNGVEKWQNLWPENHQWISEQIELDAGMMIRLAYQKMSSGKISNLFTTAPIYIKNPRITTSKKQYFD